MATIENLYTGNGSTTNYSFTFPYLNTTDIKVSVNGTNTTAYTLANATTIAFNTAPTNGAAIRIYRETDSDQLSANFYAGSAIRAQDLTKNFTQNLYVTQESKGVAADAVSIAQGAVTTAQGAVTTANSAVTSANQAVNTANAANTAASNAVTTANNANATAANAVSTANDAAHDAQVAINISEDALDVANAAVSTANNAVTSAQTAATTANSAVTTANSAVSTANTASTNATNAVNTANAANSTANTAVSTANNAVSTANTANSSASTAVTSAQGAVNTALAADTKADQAIAAVANAILYDLVANVAAIPASPSNNDAIEVQDSTGIQSFTPLTGLPSGFVGDSGLSVRLVYASATTSWTWIQYFPSDPETRYGDAITAVESDVTQLQTDVLALDTVKLDATTAASTYLSQSSAASTYLTQTNAASTYAPLSNPLFSGIVGGVDYIASGSVKWFDADVSNYVGFAAPANVTSNVVWKLPASDGASGQFLKTNGSGVLAWETPTPSALVLDGGNFDNASSTVNLSQTIDGGAF